MRSAAATAMEVGTFLSIVGIASYLSFERTQSGVYPATNLPFRFGVCDSAECTFRTPLLDATL